MWLRSWSQPWYLYDKCNWWNMSLHWKRNGTTKLSEAVHMQILLKYVTTYIFSISWLTLMTVCDFTFSWSDELSLQPAREEMIKNGSAARLISGWRRRNSSRNPAAVREDQIQDGNWRRQNCRRYEVERATSRRDEEETVARAWRQCTKIDLRMARKKQWPAPGSSAGRSNSGWQLAAAGLQALGSRSAVSWASWFLLRGDGNNLFFPGICVCVRTTLTAHRLCFASRLAPSIMGHVLLLHLIFTCITK
jgi:hypothetical protein